MNNQLTYREKFTCEMIWGGVPTDNDYVRNSALFQEGLKRYDSGEWKYYEKEEWRDVVGLEGKYVISNHGRLKGINTNSFSVKNKYPDGSYPIRIIINQKGYHFVQIYKANGKRLKTGIHRLVAQAFIPNPENKREVNHINGIKTDNHYLNLEWCTSSENIKHSIDTGLRKVKHGHLAHRAKLSLNQVLEIRELIKEGKANIDIAKQYNVTRHTIGSIRNGVTYINSI